MTRLLQFFDAAFGQQKISATLARGGVVASRFVGLRTAGAAAGTRRVFLVAIDRSASIAIVVAADCRRKHGEVDPLIAAIARLRTAAAILLIASAAIGPFAARFGAITSGPIAAAALRLLFRAAALRLLLRLVVQLAVILIVAVHVGVHPVVAILVIIIVIVAALAPLLVEPRPAIAEHTEIMIRELKIIFGLDTIARKLRIARHALVFLEQLGGIAALPIVLAITAIIAGNAPGLLSTAATSAAALTIIDQTKFPRRTGAKAPENLLLEGLVFHPPSNS